MHGTKRLCFCVVVVVDDDDDDGNDVCVLNKN
jgi:hypothetical protein